MSDNTTPHNASAYDHNIRMTIPFYEEFHRQALDLVRNVKKEPRRWLDTGCGTGYTATQAVRVFPACRFILADPSEAMLREAASNLKGLADDRISILRPAGTEQLPGIIDWAVDVVTAIQAHHYLDRESRRRATEACHELLADGGLYITFENIRPTSERGTKIALDRWMEFQLRSGRTSEEVARHAKRFDAEYFPIPVAEHLLLLSEAGFTTAELFWCSFMQAGFFALK